MTNARSYVRYSPRPDEDETESNQKQIQRCEEYAAQKDYAIVEVGAEPSTSGGFDDDCSDPIAWYESRPKLWELIEHMKRGEVLLVRWRDRIGRSVHGQEIVRMDLAAKGCRIEATDEPNGETPEARFQQQVFASMAELRRWQIKIATRRAMRRYQRDGRRMSRRDRCPYGWTVDPDNDKRLIEEPEEQATIQLALSLHKSGLKAPTICRRLDEAGRKRRGGKSWLGNHKIIAAIIARSARAS